MEFLNFIKVLLRHKFILITIPVITVLITFLLVRNLANAYQSRSRVATGIVDRPDAILNNNVPELKINQEFNNIIEGLLQKRTINQVSYLLLLHDLTEKVPFGKKSEQVAALTVPEQENLIRTVTQKYKDQRGLDITDKGDERIQQLLESMQYDEPSLRKTLLVYRLSNSDFIDMQYVAQNPYQSAFVLNNLCREFINEFTAGRNENKNRTIAYLDSMMQQKQDTLRKKMFALQDYKIRNGILDVNDQASSLIAQIAEFEAKRQEAQKNIIAYRGALQNIDARFDPNDRKYVESSLTQLNQEILSTRNRLAAVNDEYIKSNFDSKIKVRADSLQASLTEKINQTNDKSAYSPLASRKDLVQEKLNLEVSLELAKNGVSSLSSELTRLNGKLYTLVPNQAAIKTLQDDIDIYSKEYNDLLNKYNQAILDANFTTKLKQVDVAMPGIRQPSKKILLLALSGILSFICCILVLFIIFFFDHSIRDSRELANKTSIPVLGSLNLIGGNSLELNEMWEGSAGQPAELKHFKSLLRSIRFEISQLLNQHKLLAFTSLYPGAGKTFIIFNIAYAYKLANKRVAIIDGNFSDPEITRLSKTQTFIEDFLSEKNTHTSITTSSDDFLVLGNKGEDISLFEIGNHSTVQSRLRTLSDHYDIVLIEAPSLITYNKAKEWITYTDQVIPVYESGKSISGTGKQEVEYLQSNDKVMGWILNKAATPKKDKQG